MMRTVLLVGVLGVSACGEPEKGMPDGIYQVRQAEVRLCGADAWEAVDPDTFWHGWISMVVAPELPGIGVTPCPPSDRWCDRYFPVGLREAPFVQTSSTVVDEQCRLTQVEMWYEPTPADASAALTLYLRNHSQLLATDDCSADIDLTRTECTETRIHARYYARQHSDRRVAEQATLR
jgi:hypothetical protein